MTVFRASAKNFISLPFFGELFFDVIHHRLFLFLYFFVSLPHKAEEENVFV